MILQSLRRRGLSDVLIIGHSGAGPAAEFYARFKFLSSNTLTGSVLDCCSPSFGDVLAGWAPRRDIRRLLNLQAFPARCRFCWGSAFLSRRSR